MNIRALNKIIMSNVYPVLSQSEILIEFRNATHISIVDAINFFYQWWIQRYYRYRFTVASHRGQKSFRVPIIDFRNFSVYVQRIIDRILRLYREFCRAYVDDIVIFSTSLNKHIKHLNLIFRALDNMNIHLSPKKFFLGYLSVHLLGQKIDALDLTTAEKKLTIIFSLVFSRTLS